MKIEELMINDLVMYDDEVYRIKGIYGNAEMVDMYPYYLKNKEGKYLLPIQKHVSLINPIPPTPEILKKNGFNEFGGIWDFPNNSSFGVEITTLHKGIYPTFDESAYFLCGYIHELQRALRCCGLNELADNIKI